MNLVACTFLNFLETRDLEYLPRFRIAWYAHATRMRASVHRRYVRKFVRRLDEKRPCFVVGLEFGVK